MTTVPDRGVEAGKFVLDRRRFPALSSLGGIAAAAAPAAPAEALELGDPLRLVVDNRERGLRVLGSRGEFVAARGAYYAPPVPLPHMPNHLVDALVASEDRRFYDHFGLDPRSLARALLSTVTGRRQGGSTLTQQTVKEVHLKTHSPILRKLVEEPLLAPILDRNLSKEDILYVYLNRVFFGGGAYGVEAASRVYFAKYARDLSVLEAAALVSLLPAPNRLNPYRDPERATRRAHRVIDQMVEQERLPAAEAERAKRQRLAVAPPRSAWGGFHPQGAQVGWFARWAEQEADGLTDARSGTRTVLTTLENRIQKAAERHLGEALERHGGRLNIEEGAVIVMRPADGAVLAMVGGRDFRATEWNNATQARRQPGSVAKLFVYLAAAAERRFVPRRRRVAGPVGEPRLDRARPSHLHPARPSGLPVALPWRGQPATGGQRPEHPLDRSRGRPQAVARRRVRRRCVGHPRLRPVELDRRRGRPQQRGVPAGLDRAHLLRPARLLPADGRALRRDGAVRRRPAALRRRAAARTHHPHGGQVLGLGRVRRQPVLARRAHPVPQLGARGRGRNGLRGGRAGLDGGRRRGVGRRDLGPARRRLPGGAAGQRPVPRPRAHQGVAGARPGGPLLRRQRPPRGGARRLRRVAHPAVHLGGVVRQRLRDLRQEPDRLPHEAHAGAERGAGADRRPRRLRPALVERRPDPELDVHRDGSRGLGRAVAARPALGPPRRHRWAGGERRLDIGGAALPRSGRHRLHHRGRAAQLRAGVGDGSLPRRPRGARAERGAELPTRGQPGLQRGPGAGERLRAPHPHRLPTEEPDVPTTTDAPPGGLQ